jgi:hypothetical protein
MIDAANVFLITPMIFFSRRPPPPLRRFQQRYDFAGFSAAAADCGCRRRGLMPPRQRLIAAPFRQLSCRDEGRGRCVRCPPLAGHADAAIDTMTLAPFIADFIDIVASQMQMPLHFD